MLIIASYHVNTVNPALVTTCIQRPPPFREHFVMSQLWLYRDHLYHVKDHFFGPNCGRLINTSFTVLANSHLSIASISTTVCFVFLHLHVLCLEHEETARA